MAFRSLTHGRALRYAGAPRAASYTTSGDTAAQITAKSTFPASNEQKLRSWQTVDAVCQGPVLHLALNCANLEPNKLVIRWMSAYANA